MEDENKKVDPVQLVAALIALAAGLYGLSIIF